MDAAERDEDNPHSSKAAFHSEVARQLKGIAYWFRNHRSRSPFLNKSGKPWPRGEKTDGSVNWWFAEVDVKHPEGADPNAPKRIFFSTKYGPGGRLYPSSGYITWGGRKKWLHKKELGSMNHLPLRDVLLKLIEHHKKMADKERKLAQSWSG